MTAKKKLHTKDDIVEELSGRYLQEIDVATLDAGLSLVGAAEVYRTLAAEFRNRAEQLEHEFATGDRDG